jgi:hypothetical protein
LVASLDRIVGSHRINAGRCHPQPVSGSADEIAETLLSLRALGIDEVRCDLTDKTEAGIEAMEPVVEALHST